MLNVPAPSQKFQESEFVRLSEAHSLTYKFVINYSTKVFR